MDASLVGLSAVVERGQAGDGNAARAPDTADAAVEVEIFVRVRRKTGGHEIFQLGDAIFVRETRDEYIGGGPIELLLLEAIGDGHDLEVAALFVVQDGAEDAGGIEVGGTVPIHRAVHGHEGPGAHVTDDSVVFDRLGGHWAFFRAMRSRRLSRRWPADSTVAGAAL